MPITVNKMIINAFDYSMMIRSDFYKFGKSCRYSFYVDLVYPDVRKLGVKEDVSPSGYFYFCKSIKTLFVFFESEGDIFLIQKNESVCLSYDLKKSNIYIEKSNLFFDRSRRFFIESGGSSKYIFYKINILDFWVVDTDFYENPDFFEWMCNGIEEYRKTGIFFKKL